MTMTQAELDAIRKRAEAATGGPWRVYDEYCDTVECVESQKVIARIGTTDKRVADMEFIAHARGDVPKLLAEVERLRQIIETVRDETHCDDTWDFTSRALLGEEISTLSYRISVKEDSE